MQIFSLNSLQTTEHQLIRSISVMFREIIKIPGQQIRFYILHNEERYEASIKLKREHEDLEIVTLTTANGKELHLGTRWEMEYLRRECSVYAPYWAVNNTGKRISYIVSFDALFDHFQ